MDNTTLHTAHLLPYSEPDPYCVSISKLGEHAGLLD
jgi:hypothetical protein